MSLLPGFLVVCATLALSQNTGTIEDSSSPDGQYNLVALSKENGTFYHVQKKDGTWVSKEVKSNIGALRPLEEACKYTSVHWRQDGKFVIAFTGHIHHLGDFFILAQTATGFQVIPFDWEKLEEFAHLKPFGITYTWFLGWSPGGCAVVALFEFDGKGTSRTSTFDLDLNQQATPISWKMLVPEHRDNIK